jgi:hypothetical protein
MMTFCSAINACSCLPSAGLRVRFSERRRHPASLAPPTSLIQTQKTKLFRHKMWVGLGAPDRVPNPTCAEIFNVGIQIKRLVLFQTRILSKRNPSPQPVNTPKSPGKVHLDQSSVQIRRANGIMRRPCILHCLKSFKFFGHELEEFRDLAVSPRALEL